MIESPQSQTSDAPASEVSWASVVRLPVSARLARLTVLATVFVCASCGLVYELELVALASYLFGDSVTQASVVLSLMVFAMGVGSLLAKHLCRRAALAFGLLEAALALVGGCSALALYASFAWWAQSRLALVGFSLLIGVLIGAEVPLLMTLIQRIRRQDAGGAVAELFAADYVGALVGGLAFPFLLLPLLGQLTAALLTGVVNALVGGGMVLWLFRRDLTARARWLLVLTNLLVLAVLTAGVVFARPFERAAQRAVFGAEVRVSVRTDFQEVVLSGDPGSPEALSLFLDGQLRASGGTEYREHEALVHPAMNGPRRRVLVLGGGDGLALREVLRYEDVRSVTVVEVDPELVRLARTDPGLAGLNRGAFHDPRVRSTAADPFDWLRRTDDGPRYDVVVSDLPDPRSTAGAKLHSQEFYGLVQRVLAPRGRLAVDTGPAQRTVDATVRSVGLRSLPYRTADHRFVLSGRTVPEPRLPPDAPRLRSLTDGALRAAARAAAEVGRGDPPPSTLLHPRYGD
ncbi:polyamine aminopropyltransferase [Streptomyces sp. TP-A0874]|uniref:polyamine aminopropyltransferase n=1 Tax=Streptomyces sp. TP-A0874 TaxID=549819 RepID=UPI00099F57A4|nr:polyamine aminopropyltransferase [Streptomyces sp. TP-A0874]